MSWNNSIFAIHRSNKIATRLLCNKYYFSIETCKDIHSTTGKAFRFTEPYKSATLVANQKPDWNRVLSDAERIVNCPTNFLSLRWILCDEVADIAFYLKKMITTDHPVLRIIKNLIYDGRYNMQSLGLIILLVSKAAGQSTVDTLKQDKTGDILNSQRSLAEITEMIRMSFLVHKEMININSDINPDDICAMQESNKITLLTGDYMLSNICHELAEFKNQKLLQIMSSIIKDLAAAEFIGRRDNQDIQLPPTPPSNSTGYAEDQWTIKNTLSSSSMLAKSCKGALLLGGHNNEFQEHAYNFGQNLSLAWQAYLELIPFINKDSTSKFSLLSAPVLFHIEYDPTIMTDLEEGLTSIRNVDYAKVHNLIMTGPGIELTRQLRTKHSQKALELLSLFQDNDAKTALYNIITTIEDS